ncbi:MAG: glycosyltransferase [Chloroflexi bacterium]|nr:MAG: glycosyltransferase [Chloroflexota bacterium]
MLLSAQFANRLRRPLSLSVVRHALRRVRMTARSGRTVGLLKESSYETWIAQHEPDARQLDEQRGRAPTLAYQPLISLITPIYTTPPDLLRAMLESVRAQTYPNWELLVVDGASTQRHVKRLLAAAAHDDTRVRLVELPNNLGIAGNSNVALEQANGEFVALLDHDDVLAPSALFAVAQTLNDNPEWDVLYSDNDVLAEDGRTRYHPLFKPGWSPEIMLSANYMTHLTVVRSSLVRAVGGLCPAMDGAQDWDLFLKVSERSTRVAHIPQMLYHWRDSAHSTATDTNRKPYARAAQLKAIGNHLRRQGLSEARAYMDASGFIRVAWACQGTAKAQEPLRCWNNALIRSCRKHSTRISKL